MSCRMLGAKVEAWDADRRPVLDRQGELVITVPMPSMPVGLWGDTDGSRLAATYFDQNPGVWTHGDWITIHADGSCAITGRSDATLNRGGVRLGSAEIYAVLEDIAEVEDSLVIHLEERRPAPPLRRAQRRQSTERRNPEPDHRHLAPVVVPAPRPEPHRGSRGHPPDTLR